MNISRGFCRLSLVTAIIGTAFIVFCWIEGPPGQYRTIPNLAMGLFDFIEYRIISNLAMGLLVFAAAPAVLVLLVGWVVAGFQESD